ncbi:MAG: lytic transglycosylase domain-containing protein [Pseudobutyrivibrio sp.]|nr:lytic transglycosylase domain-containing protein [Pseudobutyrivibrio sp.]
MKISISTPDKGITYEEMLRTASGVAASVNTSTAENIQTSSFADAMTQANAQLSSTTVSTDYNTMSSSAAQISTLIANSIKKEDYSNNYTSSVSDDLSTVTSYDSIFREAAETFGVSYKLLISMAKQESNFDAKATSKSGAMGIMQLMPITAKALGVTDAYNPYQNIMAGAKYISDKLTEFSGDVQMALAAYNQGSGAVNRAGGIPAAAKDYVDKIMELMNTDFRVPATNYVSAEATKEEIAADVEKLLSQFSEHDSYDRFVELLEEELGSDIESLVEHPDAYTAYTDLLGPTQNAIKRLIAEI